MNLLQWLLPATIIACWMMTWALRRYALSRSLIDIPNERSSHKVPTPRGGGLAIVVSFLGALPFVLKAGLLELSLALAIWGAGAWIALLGFLDDHGHIPARWRLAGHFSGALWVLYWLGGLPPLTVFGATVSPGWFGCVLASLYLVWLLNLYNFMDGIDGIATIEAITVLAGAALIYTILGQQHLLVLPILLIASLAGFLYWNFPPARIFMGDGGSGFLGIILGALSLQAAWVEPQLLWSWLILLGVFVVDTTYTLLRRLFRGDKVYEAHRSHAYQHAALRYGNHLSVTLAVAAINLFWLLPVACWVAMGGVDGITGLLLAYLPLVALAVKYEAGKV